MKWFTQDNLIGAFLIFGAVSSIFLILSSIYKVCYKLYHCCCHSQTYQSLESDDNDKDLNKESNSIDNKEGNDNEDTISPVANIDLWNSKIEQLQAQLQALETKMDSRPRRSKSDDIQKYLPYIKHGHLQQKEEQKDKEKAIPMIMRPKSVDNETKIKRRYIGYTDFCARILHRCHYTDFQGLQITTTNITILIYINHHSKNWISNHRAALCPQCQPSIIQMLLIFTMIVMMIPNLLKLQ